MRLRARLTTQKPAATASTYSGKPMAILVNASQPVALCRNRVSCTIPREANNAVPMSVAAR